MPSQPWTQIDHVAISYRWRGSLEDCRSYWSTCVDSDHALVRARVNLRLTGRQKTVSSIHPRINLNDENIRAEYKNHLSLKLSEPLTFTDCDAG